MTPLQGNTHRAHRFVCKLLSLLVITFTLTRHARAADLVFIGNESIKSSEVSVAELRELFLGESSSLHGSKAMPVTLFKGPVHELFLAKYIGKSDLAFRAIWRQQVFTGKGSMPRSFDNEDAMVTYVSTTPGAVGYISSARAVAGVRILTVR